MKTRILIIVASLIFLSAFRTDQKPVLRQGAYYTQEQGAAELKKLETTK